MQVNQGIIFVVFFEKRRLKAAGLRCPTPILLRLHVLVMEFIGIFLNLFLFLKYILNKIKVVEEEVDVISLDTEQNK